MAKIRRLYFFDRKKIKKMISFLDSDIASQFARILNNDALACLHYFFPLPMKFLSESFVLEQDKDIMGLVTARTTAGNPYRIELTRLLFEQNYFDVGKMLVEYTIGRYGAMGATAFVAIVDSWNEELLNLFINGCNFKQCSYNALWKIEQENIPFVEEEKFRRFKNSDSEKVATLFNDGLITYYKPYLERNKKEYEETLFQGLTNSYKFRYVSENEKGDITSYFSITTYDNQNYIVDMTLSNWEDIPFDYILGFAKKQISKRQKDFNMFVKVKKYMNAAEKFENFLTEHGFSCIQSKTVLVKDFYKVIKEQSPSQKIMLLHEPTSGVAFKNFD